MTASRSIPNLPGTKIDGLIAAVNEAQDALASQGLLPHYCRADGTSAVASALAALQALPAATTEGTAVAATNACVALYEAHRVSTDAHDAADSTNAVAASAATNEATAITRINELKGDFNAHIVLDASHRGLIGSAGSVAIATIGTADATNTASLYALVEAARLALERHIEAGAKPLEVVPS